jgi:hypothetical protein
MEVDDALSTALKALSKSVPVPTASNSKQIFTHLKTWHNALKESSIDPSALQEANNHRALTQVAKQLLAPRLTQHNAKVRARGGEHMALHARTSLTLVYCSS